MLKELNKSAVSALAARGITAVSGIALTMLLPRSFSLEQVGAVYLVLNQAGFFSIFARFGLDYSVNAAMVQAGDSELQAGRTALGYWLGVLLIAALCSLVWLLLGHAAATWLQLGDAGKYIGAVTLLGSAYAMSFYLFQLYKLKGMVFKASMTRGFLPNAVIISCLLVFMVTGLQDMPFENQLLLIMLAILVAALVNCVVYLQAYFRPEYFSVRQVLQAVRGSPRFFFYSLLVFLITDVDYWFVGYFAGKDDVAVYATMKRLALIAAILIDVANLIFPKLYGQAIQNPEQMVRVARLSRRIALVATLLSLLAVAFLYFFGEPLIGVALGPDYVRGNGILLVLMLSFAGALACGFAEVFLILKNEQALLLKSMMASCVFVLVLNFFLVPRFGGMGAACTFLLSNVLMRIGFSFHVWRKYRLALFAGW